MGLTEEDKKKHPFYQAERFYFASRTKEFNEATVAFENALVDIVFQCVNATLKALQKEPDVRGVIEGTYQVTELLKTVVLTQRVPWLTTTMLERFGLVKKNDTSKIT